jgi:hypothetical protein
MDDVRENLRRMGFTDWRIRAHRRDGWKMVVKEAKVLKGLESHGVVVVVVVQSNLPGLLMIFFYFHSLSGSSWPIRG